MQGSLGNKRMLFLGEGAFLALDKQIHQPVLSCAAAVQFSRELTTILECIFLRDGKPGVELVLSKQLQIERVFVILFLKDTDFFNIVIIDEFDLTDLGTLV